MSAKILQQPCETDGRKFSVETTAVGGLVIKEIVGGKQHVVYEGALFKPLPDELPVGLEDAVNELRMAVMNPEDGE